MSEAPMTEAERAAVTIESVRPIIGLEIHVELATASKMFARAPSPAFAGCVDAPDPLANTMLDPVVMALPGALPGLNRRAVELSILVGLALNCSIAGETKWDRKGYTYPDLPKGYQISQYDLPLCYDGSVDVPGLGAKGAFDLGGEFTRVGIIRAHLEEDAGKLSHEAPGGAAFDGSLVDLNRAGTPLLEIVTQPDLSSADQAVAFCRLLRMTCRFVGATEGVMQRGHMRFEPNINCELTLAGGRTVRTPITEVKNLNSFRAVAGAIDHEIERQPGRWRETGLEIGPGTKTTRGWDDNKGVTVVQREKEDAHDYRYFPDPDLPALVVEEAWAEEIGAGLPELPLARLVRWREEMGLGADEGAVLVEERADADLFDDAVDEVVSPGSGGADAAEGEGDGKKQKKRDRRGISRERAGKAVANIVLQQVARLANERGCSLARVGLDAVQIAAIARLRDADDLSAANAGKLVEKLAEAGYAGRDPGGVAEYEGWLTVRDEGAMQGWVDEVIAANPAIVEQIRGGKPQAVGRLIGEVMGKSGGSADAKAVRAMLLERIG
jgi:aspartyl-tRNA(Asn)/glutamyl-tRNA(Gln) amidotransferase subunit B